MLLSMSFIKLLIGKAPTLGRGLDFCEETRCYPSAEVRLFRLILIDLTETGASKLMSGE